MKKTFKLQDLDCANCAAKMENEINKLEGVEATVSFMTQKLTVSAPDEGFEDTIFLSSLPFFVTISQNFSYVTVK